MNTPAIDRETQLPVDLQNRITSAERGIARAREALAEATGRLTALAPKVRDWFTENPQLVSKRKV